MTKKEYKAAYYLKNRERLLAETSAWAKANRDKRREICKRHYNKHKEQEQQRSRDYAKDHPATKQAQCARRRAMLLQRTPKWLTALDHEHIKLFYEASSAMTKETGVVFEVDHILPLKSDFISGLHVPGNLQVLKRDGPNGNRSKSNKVQD